MIDLSRNFRNSVVVSSMGRSGSTLLLNILNHKKKYREIFEPFFPDRVKEAKDFFYPQYIRPDNREEKYLIPAGLIFSGKIRNPWTDRSGKLIRARKRLIKDIRINLFLKWIKVNFPQIPIILLIRSPFATVHSWQKAGFGDGSLARERILAQNDLVKDFLAPFKENYMKMKDSFERLIFFWCLYYFVPLKQFMTAEVHLVFYENFFLKPEKEIIELFSFINDFYSDEVFDILRKPSVTAREESEILMEKGDILNGWKKYMSDVQIEKGLEILSQFGMQNIYSRDSEPAEGEILKFVNGKHG